jgi:hypothetical protein
MLRIGGYASAHTHRSMRIYGWSSADALWWNDGVHPQAHGGCAA